jgi:hypothetical protein
MLTVYRPGYEMFRKQITYASPVAGMIVPLRRDRGVAIKARDAGSGRPLQDLYAIEMIGDRNGSRLRLQLDENGTAYIPAALAGSTLSFSAAGYLPAVIRAWSGKELDLRLARQEQ